MSVLRSLTRGIRALIKPDDRARDLRDEISSYFEEAAAELEADGMSPEEARRKVRLRFGSATAARQEIQESGWEHTAETIVGDVRYAIRRLRSTPGFTIVTVVILALGIGATTAIFSLLNPILLQRLPYPDPQRIVIIWDVGGDRSPLEVTYGTFREIVERSQTIETAAVWRPWQPTLSGEAHPERLDGQRVTAEYFSVLGVAPLLGRDFDAEDDRIIGPPLVIISNALWRRRFAGDLRVVGRALKLDEVDHVVVGVMPPTFENVLAPAADVWRPLRYDPSLPPQGREWGHHLRMVARLRPDTGIDRITSELARIAAAPVDAFSRPRWAALEAGLLVHPLQQDVARHVQPALLAVFTAVLLLLGIVCLNVTNLLLARGVQRTGEFALRAALGGGRGRLIRQLLTESLLLAALGGAAGMALAAVAVKSLLLLVPLELPRAQAIGVNGSVYVFACGVTALVGVVVGLVPALQVSRGALLFGIQRSSSRMISAPRKLRGLLVTAEVALAVVLLIGAGLLLRTVQGLFAIHPGFEAPQLLRMQVQTSGARFDDPATSQRFFAAALEAVAGVAGVASAGWTSQLPLSGDVSIYGVHLAPNPAQEIEEDSGAFRYAVSPGYFKTMGIPLRRGRLLNAHDVAGAPLAAVISESFAHRRFPGSDPIGRRLHVGPVSGESYTVVGVVGDVRQTSLAVGESVAVYTTPSQWHFPELVLWLVVRGQVDDVRSLAPAIQRAVWTADANQAIVRVGTMSDLVESSVAEQRFGLLLFQVFGIVSLMLAAVGIYGVLAGTVGERTREIGIRSALGASRAEIVGMVVRQGMTFTAIGAVTGLMCAVGAMRVLRTMLFQVSLVDLPTYAGAIVLLGAVAVLACSGPAWKASRIDPALALKVQ